MNPKFTFTINSVETVGEIPSTWSPAECLTLLHELEFDDVENIPEEQLREYAVMALQDLECDEAAAALLEITIGKKLADGKKQNISQEMETDRLWEEYSDLSCHELIFNAQFLLYQAFPKAQQPEVHKIEASIHPIDQAAEAYIKENATNGLPEAFIARCIAAAQPDDSILNRLFEDQIAGADFAEAEHLVWHVQSVPIPADGNTKAGVKLTLYSPIRWTQHLEEEQTIECSPRLP